MSPSFTAGHRAADQHGADAFSRNRPPSRLEHLVPARRTHRGRPRTSTPPTLIASIQNGGSIPLGEERTTHCSTPTCSMAIQHALRYLVAAGCARRRRAFEPTPQRRQPPAATLTPLPPPDSANAKIRCSTCNSTNPASRSVIASPQSGIPRHIPGDARATSSISNSANSQIKLRPLPDRLQVAIDTPQSMTNESIDPTPR